MNRLRSRNPNLFRISRNIAPAVGIVALFGIAYAHRPAFDAAPMHHMKAHVEIPEVRKLGKIGTIIAEGQLRLGVMNSIDTVLAQPTDIPKPNWCFTRTDLGAPNKHCKITKNGLTYEFSGYLSGTLDQADVQGELFTSVTNETGTLTQEEITIDRGVMRASDMSDRNCSAPLNRLEPALYCLTDSLNQIESVLDHAAVNS
jgi:hypothetical protein